VLQVNPRALQPDHPITAIRRYPTLHLYSDTLLVGRCYPTDVTSAAAYHHVPPPTSGLLPASFCPVLPPHYGGGDVTTDVTAGAPGGSAARDYVTPAGAGTHYVLNIIHRGGSDVTESMAWCMVTI